MLWLGFWQLDKSGLRTTQLANYAAADAREPTRYDASESAVAFDRLLVTGRFDVDRQLLVDSIVRNGQNGFFVISLLTLDDGAALLVNRGWIPQTPTREPIGELSLPAGDVSLSGRVGRMPVGGLKLGEVDTNITRWPAVVHYPTLEEAGDMLGVTPIDWVLLVDSGPGDMLREWQPGGLPPERHLGYAVQWFALSTALTLLLLVSFVRARKGTQE